MLPNSWNADKKVVKQIARNSYFVDNLSHDLKKHDGAIKRRKGKQTHLKRPKGVIIDVSC